MNPKLNQIVLVWAAPVVLGVAAAIVGIHYLPESIAQQAKRQAELAPPVHFTAVSVNLPPGSSTFPPGEGVEIANANCVICHSPGMVLRQPPLTISEWKTEIMKMRNAFGAPISVDQVDALSRYLNLINGRKSEAAPSGVSSEAS
jgi:mono/diheme cytochrome c family protein